MENASKALLIAAAVLIVILLIAFGMNIFNSTGDTSSDAQATGEAISSATTSSKVKALLAMIDITDEDAFKALIKQNYVNKKLSKNEVIEVCELVAQRSQKAFGSRYKSDKVRVTSASGYVAQINAPTGIIYYKNLDDGKTYELNTSFFQNHNSIVIEETN